MADDIEHRAGCKGQAPGQQRLADADDAGTDQAPDRFQQPGQGRDPEGPPAGISLAQQGDGDRQPFGDVLQADANRQRHAAIHPTGPKADADRQTFGEIMDRDGDHEQPDPAQRCRCWAFTADLEMLMRQHLVHQGDRAHAQQDRRADDQRRDRAAAIDGLGRIQRGDDQRKERCGQHDAGGKAQRQVTKGPAWRAAEQHRQGPHRGHQPGDQAAQKPEHGRGKFRHFSAP